MLFHTIGIADGALATIVQVPDSEVICSGDIVYNKIHMWLWKSTPDSRKEWLASLDAVAALKPSTIITGHKDPDAPDDDATRVLDQSRRYIQDFDQAVAKAQKRLERRELIQPDGIQAIETDNGVKWCKRWKVAPYLHVATPGVASGGPAATQRGPAATQMEPAAPSGVA